jgi:beta-mannosidase
MHTQLLLEGWTFKASDEETWLPAKVPGTVHGDLLRNGIIPDPFYGTNEKDLQWIDKKDWEYRTFFDLDDSLAACNRTDIVFDGLDTYADVYLNGRLIVQADNMFRTWRADVKGILRKENNELFIRFRSPVKEDLPKLEKLGLVLPAGNDDSQLGGIGDRKISMFARKAPYHYGWDWGPRFVTSGIWREVRLEGFSGVRIADVFIRQNEVTAQHALLTADIEAELDGSLTPAKVRVRWDNGEACREWPLRGTGAGTGGGGKAFAAENACAVGEVPATGRGPEPGHAAACGAASAAESVPAAAGTVSFGLDFAVPQPRLWWCRGLGEPNLYTFRVSLEDRHGNVLAERLVRTGLRSVRLAIEPDADGQGSSFRFELNGVPVFAKGANHIPNDSFLTEVTRERYRHEIASAAEANMNMLRVWGGGIYEQDDFYKLCDEYGIMVWQDFMFACTIYPGDEAFLENVRREAADNLKRLRNHPSIVLWCGNNEIDMGWVHYGEHPGWGWKALYTKEQEEMLWAGYEALFHRILPEEVAKHAPGAAYWPSSPMAMWTGDERQHAVGVQPHGDVHYWNVWHNAEPFEHYDDNVGRFMSEYGFQSFPEPRTVEGYAPEEQMALESDVMLAHQKNGHGNRLIKTYMDRYMREPKDFRSFLLMSQALQAEGVGRAMEAHRRNKPHCMGSLYWQINDCWPVASWSSMDYHGRWKALHYAAKRLYRDTAVVVEQADGVLRFHVIHDRNEPAVGELRIRLADYAGKEHKSWTVPVNVSAGERAVVHAAPVADVLGGLAREQAVLIADLTVGGSWQDEKRVYFVDGKTLPLEPVTIRVEPVQGDEGAQRSCAGHSDSGAQGSEGDQRYGDIRSAGLARGDVAVRGPGAARGGGAANGSRAAERFAPCDGGAGLGHAFAVTADKFARHVRLFAEAEGVFSDNDFDLLPGETKIVRFFARSDGETAFVPASPGRVWAESMADWVKL